MFTAREFERRGVAFRYAQAEGSSGPPQFYCRAPAEFRAIVSEEIERRCWAMLVAIDRVRMRQFYRLGEPNSSREKYVHPAIKDMVPITSFAEGPVPRFGHCPMCGEATKPHLTGDCDLCNAARRQLLRRLGRLV
jgi:hypothetical protein